MRRLLSPLRDVPRLLALVVAINAGVPLESRAQVNGGCRDILANGTYSYQQYLNNSSFMQIVYTHFLQSDFASSHEATIAGMKVPVGDIILGADYSKEKYAERKQQLESTNFSKIDQRNETSALVSSGDPTIVGAWSKCMDNSSGVFVTLEELQPTLARALIEYRFPPGGKPMSLDADIVLGPGVVVRSGQGCLTTAQMYNHKEQCAVTMDLDTPLRTLFVDAKIGISTAYAFLPKRVELQTFVNDVVFTAKDTLVGAGNGEYRDVTNVVNLPANLKQDGWRFDTSQKLFNFVILAAGDGNKSCYQPTANGSTPTQLQYFFTVGPNSRCRLDPVAQMMQVRFVPKQP